MRLYSEVVARVRSLLDGRREDEELDEELRFHLEKDIQKHLAAGMNAREARRQARLRLGGVDQVKERTRQARGVQAVEELFSTARFALRSLRSTPLLSVIAILTIAVGVALTTTTFSVVSAVLLPSSDRLVALDLVSLNSGGAPQQFEALDLRDFRDRQSSFEELAGYYRGSAAITDLDGFMRSVAAGVVTANALDLLDVPPHLGRTFLPGEDFTPNLRHVVLGYDIWQNRFGGSEEVLGTTLRIDGRSLEVIGVMPAGFAFPTAEALWIPMNFEMPTTDRGSGRSFEVFGRLREGVSIEAANAEVQLLAGQLASENADVFPPLSATAYPLFERHLPGGITPLLKVMLAAVFAVLFIACANVANLVLARTFGRIHEVSIRRALGAGRGRIVLQVLMESLALSAAGCVLGLGLTAISMDAVRLSLTNVSLPYWVDVSLSTPATVLVAGLLLLVTLAIGTWPAIHASRTTPAAAIRDGARGSTGRSAAITRNVLVSMQVAMATALLIGAGLLVKSLVQLRSQDLGYDPSRVVVADLRFPAAEYPDNQSYPSLFAEVLDGVAALPGVDGTSLARGAPGDGGTFSWRFEVQGDLRSPTEYPAADGVPVASDYFRVMGIELLQGREFLREENRFGVEPVVIVNETLARRRLGADPIGRRIRVGGGDAPWLAVVGVVEDTYIGSSSGGIAMDEAARDQIYVSWGIAPYSFGTLLVGTERDPDQLVREVRIFLRESGLNIPVYNVDRLSNVIANSTWSFGLFGSAFGVFGGVALFLAAVGLYGVIASTVRQRRPELTIRMALGAGPGSIFRLVFRQVGKLLLVGMGIGLVLSTALGRGIEATLFGVGTSDPIVYAFVLATVTGTGLLAILLPAYGAARANLVDVLLR